jgi:aspartate-semialdehyde dehydrogenase
MEKTKVAVLGCTGIVGQVFLWQLDQHEWFEVDFISATSSRDHKIYGDEVKWMLPVAMPERIKGLVIEPLDPAKLKERGIGIVFSALPAVVAKTVEKQLVDENFYVFSNASAYRYEEDVPILIPEANRETIGLIQKQGFPGRGFVVTNANCSITGLAVALAPLRQFSIKKVFVSTYQSISGAGYPGLSAMDISGNMVPYIQNEEEKMVRELKKILAIDAEVYPHCVRVNTLFGHLETVWLDFEQEVETADLLNAWQNFSFKEGEIPLLPEHPVVYQSQPDAPQPRHSFLGTPPGMQVFTGGLKKTGNTLGFRLLVNNLVKGAAGGSIQNAGLFIKKYGAQL